MRNCFSGYKLLLAGALAVALSSCERINGIDNNNVIVKPFSLYVSDTFGLLTVSNDGSEYVQMASKTNDGIPMRAITTSGNNIIYVKNNAFVSSDNGNNFNYIGAVASLLSTNQSMVLDAQGFNRVYLAAQDGSGILYSDENGQYDTWVNDKTFDDKIIPGYQITSFTQLKNGRVFAFDHTNKRLFKKESRDVKWVEMPMSGFTGSGLMYLSHFGNTLIITDFAGSGMWYSNNEGATWSQYAGLPKNVSYNVVMAPFDQVLLLGTGGKGIYRFDPTTNTFVEANSGIESNTTVRSITAKDRVYKNAEENSSTSRNYIFLATHTGIYRSEDLGQNWFLVRQGIYTAIH